MANVKTSDRKLERLALKAICANGAVSKRLLARLDESYFGNPLNKVAFKRILNVLKKNNEIISWRSLTHDSALSDKVKEALSSFTTKMVLNKQVAEDIYNQLYSYRKRRSLDNVARFINEKQISGNYDEDELLEEVTNLVTIARTKKEVEKPLVFGKGSNYKAIMEKVLAGEALKTLPTGFAVWDEVNGGIVAKTVTLVKGFTGSMKTTLTEVLSCNLADQGARVGQMSLEMSQEEILILRAARAARIDRTEILLAKNLTGKQQEQIRVALYKRNKHWKNVGGCVETHTPSNGITMNELFLTMEPHGYDVLVIDYASLIDDMMSNDAFWRNLIALTKRAKQFSNKTNCRVVILVQSDEDNKVRFSKNMANDADLVWDIQFNEDFTDSEFMDIATSKARKQKPMRFPLKKSGKYADVSNCTDEELQQFRTDEKLGKVDVKNKKTKVYEESETVNVRGKRKKSNEDIEIEDYFNNASLGE